MGRTISEVMTPDPVTIDATRTVADAAAAMRDRDIGDVLVTRDGELCGIVTDRDIVVRAVAEGRDPSTVPVEDVCSADVACLSPEDDSDEAVRLMRSRAVRRVPVVENGRPVGVVSIGDLAVEKDPESALADISAASPNT